MGSRDSFFEATFSQVPASYGAIGNPAAQGDMIRIVNSLNQDVELEILTLNYTNMGNGAENVVIKAFDTYTRPFQHSGGIRIRHRGVAPTSGSIFVDSFSSTY